MSRRLGATFFVLMIAAAGCGDDDGGAIDASSADVAQVDGMVGPGECGVSVVFPLFETALEDIAVVFSDSSGALLHDTLADTNGDARYSACPPNTMVTLLIEDSSFVRTVAITYGGINPGQTIVVGGLPRVPPVDPASSLSVSLSDVDVPGAAATYRFTSGLLCKDTGVIGVPLTATISQACLGDNPDTIDVLAEAVDGSDAVVGYDFATDVEVEVGGITVVGAPEGLDGWELAGTLDVNVSNIPAGDGTLELTTSQYRDGILFERGTTGAPVPLAGPSYSDSRKALPAAFVDRMTYEVALSYDDRGRRTMVGLLPPGSDLEVDMAASPPRVSALASLADPLRPVVTIYPDSPITEADAVGITLGNPAQTWVVMTPSATFSGEFVFPILPATYADYVPGSPGGVGVTYGNYAGVDYSDLVTDARFDISRVFSASIVEVLVSGESASFSGYVGQL